MPFYLNSNLLAFHQGAVWFFPVAAHILAFASTTYTLSPDKLARALHLYHVRVLLHFGGAAWNIAALWLLVHFRVGGVIRNWSAAISCKRWVQGFLVAPVWLLLLAVIGLPPDLLWQSTLRSYGLSVQSWTSWFGDWGLSALLTLLFGALTLSVLYALMRKAKRSWWLWFWLLAIPVEIFAIFIMPVVIDPLFNHFQPLAKSDPALVVQLERVAARGEMQISPDRMFIMDASSKLTGANAYVTGFGASKRIVVWDNTIKHVPLDEILMIYGHEQGHYVLHHIAKGLMFSAIVMFVFFLIAYWLMHMLIHRYGAVWRIPSVDDWASVGLVLLLMMMLGFIAEPVGNAFSRWEEHQADVYGQEVVHGIIADPQQTGARSFARLGEMWLDYPYPNRFVSFWTASHPSTADRVDFAAHYNPWRDGQHPQFFTK